ncbi:MAG TPA: hypothetical protein VN625_09700 [Desulfuromonadaceae bacterium]|nr:hypothetical protein [Desulfuromonadaceae bacterium]
MKYEKKFIRKEQQQVSESHQQQQSAGKEFGSVEEMLRYDVQQTQVPPDLTHRLNQSLSKEPSAVRRSWWQRLWGK